MIEQPLFSNRHANIIKRLIPIIPILHP